MALVRPVFPLLYRPGISGDARLRRGGHSEGFTNGVRSGYLGLRACRVRHSASPPIRAYTRLPGAVWGGTRTPAPTDNSRLLVHGSVPLCLAREKIFRRSRSRWRIVPAAHCCIPSGSDRTALRIDAGVLCSNPAVVAKSRTSRPSDARSDGVGAEFSRGSVQPFLRLPGLRTHCDRRARPSPPSKVTPLPGFPTDHSGKFTR